MLAKVAGRCSIRSRTGTEIELGDVQTLEIRYGNGM